MISSSLWPLQAAVYKALVSNTALTTACNGVFDSLAPANTQYPYVVIGEAMETNNDLLARIGREVSLTIHIWSNYQGTRELKQLANMVTSTLDRTLLNAADWNISFAAFESFLTLVETDNIYHGVLKIRYKLSPKV